MAVFCIFAKWPLNPVSNISVGMLKLNWWTGRTSGSLSSSFFGNFRSNIPSACTAAARGMFFKGKSGHITALLRSRAVSSLTQAKAHTMPAKALSIYPSCASCSPSLSPPSCAHRTPSTPALLFLGHLRSCPSPALAVPSASIL